MATTPTADYSDLTESLLRAQDGNLLPGFKKNTTEAAPLGAARYEQAGATETEVEQIGQLLPSDENIAEPENQAYVPFEIPLQAQHYTPTASMMSGSDMISLGKGEVISSISTTSTDFEMRPDGLFAKHNEDDEGWRRVSSSFEAYPVLNKQGVKFAIIVMLPPNMHPVIIKNGDLVIGTGKCFKQLCDAGLLVEEKGQKPLFQYLRAVRNQFLALQTVTDSCGWVTNYDQFAIGYVAPHINVGAKGCLPPLLYSGGNIYTRQNTVVNGSLQGWAQTVGLLSLHSDHMIFAISASLSAPFLILMGMSGVCYNFFGPSSTGKSTLLVCASSLMPRMPGSQCLILSWRTTSNGMEEYCLRHNDGVLLLDEMGEADPKVVNELAYMISNGQGKQRYGKPGNENPWRLICHSTSEISSSDHMQAGGLKHQGGQSVRMLDIPISTEENRYGIFKSLPAGMSAATLSKELRYASNANFGFAFPCFIEFILAEQSTILPRVRSLMDEFKTRLPLITNGQVERVIEHFALAAAAGELAIQAGILPWPSGQALTSTYNVFIAWYDNFNMLTKPIEDQIIECLFSVLERQGKSGFKPYRDAYGAVGNLGDCFGYRQQLGSTLELILPKDGFCKLFQGFPYMECCKILADRGMLLKDGRNCMTKRSIPGNPHSRCYVIRVHNYDGLL